jgi:hypothetical protein
MCCQQAMSRADMVLACETGMKLKIKASLPLCR